jgi:hypothetical protein
LGKGGGVSLPKRLAAVTRPDRCQHALQARGGLGLLSAATLAGMTTLPFLSFADATSRATDALVIVTGALVIVTGVLAVTAFLSDRSARSAAKKQEDALRDATSKQVDAMRDSSARQVAAAQDEISAMRETTAEQVAAAREGVDALHRPLFIEVAPTAPISPDMGAHRQPDINVAPGREIPMTITLRLPGLASVEIDPRMLFVRMDAGSAFVSVPLRNVGRGLAVVDQQRVTMTGPTLGDIQAILVRRVRVPDRETTRVTVRAYAVGSQVLTPKDQWVLRVPYTDFASKQRTVAVFTMAPSPEGSQQWGILGVENERG